MTPAVPVHTCPVWTGTVLLEDCTMVLSQRNTSVSPQYQLDPSSLHTMVSVSPEARCTPEHDLTPPPPSSSVHALWFWRRTEQLSWSRCSLQLHVGRRRCPHRSTKQGVIKSPPAGPDAERFCKAWHTVVPQRSSLGVICLGWRELLQVRLQNHSVETNPRTTGAETTGSLYLDVPSLIRT